MILKDDTEIISRMSCLKHSENKSQMTLNQSSLHQMSSTKEDLSIQQAVRLFFRRMINYSDRKSVLYISTLSRIISPKFTFTYLQSILLLYQ